MVYFSYIIVVIGEETRVPEENHRPQVTDQLDTLSSTLSQSGDLTRNFCSDKHWLHIYVNPTTIS